MSAEQPPRFVSVTVDGLRPEDRRVQSVEDTIRAIAGPSEVTWRNGVMLLTTNGTRRLCAAVIEGRHPGDKAAAALLLNQLPPA